jgi:hypothetical protein
LVQTLSAQINVFVSEYNAGCSADADALHATLTLDLPGMRNAR